jgi:hypothetical protein
MSSLWLQKLVLLDLYRRLIVDLAYDKLIIRTYLAVFLLSYLVCQMTIITECRPFRLYWQVVKAPGIVIRYPSFPGLDTHDCAQARVAMIN